MLAAACRALWGLVLLVPLLTTHAFAQADSLLTLSLTNTGDLKVATPPLNQPLLLVTSLPQGLGSNDIGLDRGQLGSKRLVQFEQHNQHWVLRQLNTQYIASSSNAQEQQAAVDAFASAILWRGKIDDGSADLTPLLFEDLQRLTNRLNQTEQGQYRLDPNTSFIPQAGLKTFIDNADVDVQLNLRGNHPGDQVWQVAADPERLALKVRFSFIRLPKQPMTPVPYHPQSGYIAMQFSDYGQPLDRPIERRWLVKHRLEKTQPGTAPSPVKKPIVYYLDNGVPEPMRSALLEGARWWADAFEAAGFIDAYRVELLPEGADPQDMRYNMIQWVHRATRGWSFGDAIVDPRSGEILKGHVTLGSLRVRQDHLIARGLTSGWQEREQAFAQAEQFALNRLKQLSAHEVGHTLGLAHNFAASAIGNGSVMDYPHPQLTLNQERIEISPGYNTGMGDWDKFAIAFGYGDRDQQPQRLRDANQQRLKFISDADARPQGGSHPQAHLWDNGDSPTQELNKLMQIRTLALQTLSPSALLDNEPQSQLNAMLVPIYLLTRYQLEAVSKLIAGQQYHYAIGETSQSAWVSEQQQTEALSALLAQIDPEQLQLPESVQKQLLPPAQGYRPTRENFQSRLGLQQDPLGMAEVLSRHTLALLMHPQRLNRLLEQHWQDDELPGLEQVLEEIQEATLLESLDSDARGAIAMRVNAVVADQWLVSLHHQDTSPEAKALLASMLSETVTSFEKRARRSNRLHAAHYKLLAQRLTDGLTDPKVRVIDHPLKMPPGSPI
ncbi:zinc-dependent metalloprotease [Ferrimonas aestuarii]|uniref:zinc-dependent metalloprotease n=1 Tax=Ferrimonas aestuarii TaxID=2569539 RepID=UPI001E5A9146|nr:zinc-dependent metalloprotease [Ferrimonas aestuarii]